MHPATGREEDSGSGHSLTLREAERMFHGTGKAVGARFQIYLRLCSWEGVGTVEVSERYQFRKDLEAVGE